MARTNIHFDENKRKLIEIAYTLFLEKGYEDTSVNDILKAAKISRGAMYHYFSSKEEILDKVIDYLLNLQSSQLNDIVADGDATALDKLERLLLPHAPPPELFRQAVKAMHRNTKTIFFHLLKEEARKRSIPLVAAIIGQGVKEGVFYTDYPNQMADYIYTVGQSLSAAFSLNPIGIGCEDLDAFMFLLKQTLGMDNDSVLKFREPFAKAFSLI